MPQTSPSLESLTRRLAELPADFLGEPLRGHKGDVYTAALIRDGFETNGVQLDVADLAAFEPVASADRNQRLLVAIGLWLIVSDAFAAKPDHAPALLRALDTDITALAAHASALRYHTDPERREEFARLLLARTGRRPQGESKEVARDRLAAISSVERAHLIAASRAAEQRARELREALIKKAAEESADKWTRE